MSLRYVWEKWNRQSKTVYTERKENNTAYKWTGSTQFRSLEVLVEYGRTYNFNKNTGEYSIPNAYTKSISSYDPLENGDLTGAYYLIITPQSSNTKPPSDAKMFGTSDGNVHWYGVDNIYTMTGEISIGVDYDYYASQSTEYSKGSTSYGNVTSGNRSGYERRWS